MIFAKVALSSQPYGIKDIRIQKTWKDYFEDPPKYNRIVLFRQRKQKLNFSQLLSGSSQQFRKAFTSDVMITLHLNSILAVDVFDT